MTATWRDADKILCVRLDAMGDLLMTTPALRAVKESHPGRHLTLLTSQGAAEAASLIPEVDETIVYDAPWMKASAPPSGGTSDLAMAKRLRRGGFDAAIIFTVYTQNPLPAAFLCHLAEIPLRLAHCRENPYYLLTNWVEETEPARQVRHEVQRQLDLVASVGYHTANDRLSIRTSRRAVEEGRALVRESGLDPGNYVLMHPGASAPSRRYAPERFIEVGRRLLRETGRPLLLTGAPSEVALIDQVRAGIGGRCVSLAGRLSLEVFGAVVRDASLLISNNTGPVHVAAAVGTPVVDIYALTNPQHTPWRVPHRLLFRDVPCRYCYKSVCPKGHHECLDLVPPEDVVAAAVDLLGVRAGRPLTAPVAELPRLFPESIRRLVALPADGGGG